ncbi:MAG: hypothetical protein U0414_30440 [Polyangiaceae bacterium]
MRGARLGVRCAAIGGVVLSIGACGGQVDFISSSGTGSGGGAGATVASGASTTGSGSASGSTGSAACDPEDHTIDEADYVTDCAVDTDCVPAFFGDLCGPCDCPLAGAIQVSSKPAYDADIQARQIGTPPNECFCPAAGVACVDGQCEVKIP